MILHLDQPENKKFQFVQLLEDIKPLLDQEAAISKKTRLRIVFAMTARQLDTCKELLPRISRCVDYVYLATYDNYVSENQFKTAYVNPLKSNDPMKTNSTIMHITRKAITNGISPEKLVVGLSLWGRSYVLNIDENTAGPAEDGAPASEWGYPGKYTQKRGKLSYFEICNTKRREFEDEDAAAVSMLFPPKQWASYNPPADIFKQKVKWIQNQKYAGVGLMSLDADDFNDMCRRGRYPLLQSVASTLRCKPYKELPPVDDDMIPIQQPQSSQLAVGPRHVHESVRFCYFRPEMDTSEFDFMNIGEPTWCSHLVISFLRLLPDGTLGLRNYLYDVAVLHSKAT